MASSRPAFSAFSAFSALALAAGAGGAGALGTGCTEAHASSRHVRELVVGPAHGCVVYVDGTVACWSLATRTASGALVSASTWRRAVRVPGITRAASVALSYVHGCALDPRGDVACWSYSDRELSRPTAAMRVHVAPKLARLEGHGVDATLCATALATGAAYCWSSYASRNWFGDPTMSFSRSPFGLRGDAGDEADASVETVTPAGVPTERARAVVRGRHDTCALWDDDRVECWEREGTKSFAVTLP